MQFEQGRCWHSTAADDDLWFLTVVDDRVVASSILYHRSIRTPAEEFVVGGIGNVCSHTRFRGAGAARRCMIAIAEYLTTGGKVDFGMLFCYKSLREYYARLEWQIVRNAIAYVDRDGERKVSEGGTHSHTMIYPGRRAVEDWPDGEIDLNGPDW